MSGKRYLKGLKFGMLLQLAVGLSGIGVGYAALPVGGGGTGHGAQQLSAGGGVPRTERAGRRADHLLRCEDDGEEGSVTQIRYRKRNRRFSLSAKAEKPRIHQYAGLFAVKCSSDFCGAAVSEWQRTQYFPAPIDPA